MAYGGGTYTRGVYPADDLPGAYTNIRSEEVKTLYPGIGGVVAVAIPLDWGAENKLIRIDARDFAENTLKVFGVPANDPSLMPIREILAGGAKSVLVFRMNGVSTKAKTPTEIDGTPVAIGQIAEARYGGAAGNNLATACLEAIGIEDALEVQTLLYGQVVDSQIVSATVDPDTYDLVGDWDDLIDNEWIVWNRSGGDLIPHEATPFLMEFRVNRLHCKQQLSDTNLVKLSSILWLYQQTMQLKNKLMQIGLTPCIPTAESVHVLF